MLESRRLFGEMTVQENLRLAEEHGQAHRSANLQFTWQRICDLFPLIAERILVDVRYEIRATNSIHNLVFPFYLTGS